MKGKIYHWFDSFGIFHQKYIIIPTEPSNCSVPEYSTSIAFTTSQGFINFKIQGVISMQTSKCYVSMFSLDNWYWTLIAIIWWILSRAMTIDFPIITKTFSLWKSYRHCLVLYLGGKNTIISDDSFIVTNRGLDNYIYAA